MEIKEQTRLRFIGMDFPLIELKSTNSFAETEDNKVNVEITPRFFIPESPANLFKIIMNAELSVDEHFSLKIVGVGTFELSREDVTEDERKMFVNANATAIVFPYMRAIIATITSNVGKVITPILLPPRFFKGELEEMKMPTKKVRAKKNIETKRQKNIQ
jgi:preprotein translocase subunit SecB